MQKEQIQRLADIEANTEIRGVDFEELNDRLLKGKIDLTEQLKQKEHKQLSESREFYLTKLYDFLSNIRNYLNNCYYANDERVKEIVGYLDIEMGLVDCEQSHLEAIKLRVAKDEANEFEAENIELING